MIVSFGHIRMDIQIDIPSSLTPGSQHHSTQNIIEIGGSSALQTIAAARCGAKATIRGTTGNDLFAEKIFTTLRREGIQHNALIREDSSTSIATTITSPSSSPTMFIPSQHALDNLEDLIPDTSLHARTLLLLNHETHESTLDSFLTRTQSSEAKSILCVEYKNDIDPALLKKADLVIFGYQNDDKDKIESCITFDATAPHSCFISKTNTSVEVPALPQSSDGIIHPSGAFDVFCGFMASCIQAGLSMTTSAEYGLHAAQITASRPGTYRAIPYLDEVKKQIEKSGALETA